MTECILAHLPWIGLSLTILGGVILLVALIGWIGKQIWIGRDDWTIESSYKRSEPIGAFKGSWVSNDIQRKNADIVIDISKGKAKNGRLIGRIQFIQGIKDRWAYPIKWAVTLTDEANTIIPEWDSIEQTERSFGRGIDIELARPRLLRSIAIVIVEPKPEGDNSPTHARYWGFSDLRLTEIRVPWLPKWRFLSKLRKGIIL